MVRRRQGRSGPVVFLTLKVFGLLAAFECSKFEMIETMMMSFKIASATLLACDDLV